MSKICNKCGAPKEPYEFSANVRSPDGKQRNCKLCCAAYSRERYREKVRMGWKDVRPDRYDTRARMQDIIFAHYGAVCACCGEANRRFLTIDHIHGDGASHKRAMGNGYRVLMDIIRSGFPRDRYRILCMNCNWAARFGYTCPHESINTQAMVQGMAC